MKSIITSALFLASALSATAQEVLTIDRCREMALQNNVEIKAAQSQTESAEYTRKSYRANYFPQLSLNILGAYSDIEGEKEIGVPSNYQMPVLKPGADFKPQPFNPANPMDMAQKLAGYLYFPGLSQALSYEVGPVLVAGVSLQQPIYMGGKIANASKVAGMAVEMSKQNELLTQTNVVKAADEAYALVVRAKELQKVALAYNQVLADLMDNVQKAKAQGMKTGNDVLKVQVKLNESELNMQKAANGIVLAKMNLCHVVGLPLNSDIDVADGYPSVDVRDGSVEQRPETALLNQKVAIAEAKTKIERSALLPEVGAQVSYSYVNGFKVNDEKLFDDFDLLAVLKVKVPLCNFGKSSNKVRAAKSSLTQARLEQQNLTEKMELEQQRAKNTMAEAEKELVVADKSLEQAAENMRASRSMYANGVETLTDYMEAQVLWQKAMAGKVDAEFQLYLSKVELNRTSGTLLQ